MARILLPTDFSENAHAAAEYAIGLFGRTGHDYVVLHAYSDLGLNNPMLHSMASEVLATAREQLEQAVARLREATGAEGIVGRMENGPISMAVRTIVRNEGADLVVMGRRGLAGAALFGSNTTDTIRNGDIAVLAVPEKVEGTVLGRVLLANDHAEITAASLAPLRAIAQATRCAVTVAHISKEGAADDRHWDQGIYETALVGVPLRFVDHPGDDVAAAIADAADAQNADMIAVLHRQRGFLDRLFSPSVARKLALESHLPLLVLAQG
ncbi:MAG: universal stress protein [Flavobacteriales bacterium]|jgi:nucleotide-binding universal stress UspA family protein|nr:universal stress protein [Flavobacteriales bacterium]